MDDPAKPARPADQEEAAPLYDRDFYAWTQEQGRLLRERRFNSVDWENTAEEIESLGESQRQEIENRLERLLCHLLKWRHQPQMQTNSWRATIVEQRFRIARRIAKSPSLKEYPAEVLADEYGIARLTASGETGLPEEAFPAVCPFTIGQILDPTYWPDAA